MQGPLSHLKVLELADDVPASFCGRQFALWGADVAVIEPPGGLRLCKLEPIVPVPEGEDLSVLAEWLLMDKRVVRLDTRDLDRAKAISHDVDVVISDWPLDRLESLSMAPSDVLERNPRAVFLLMSPFGIDGPYAGDQSTELILQALSGFMSLNGQPDRPPLKAAGYLASYGAGASAFIGALAALRERRRSGLGQLVEVSCLEAVTSLVPLLRTEYSGVDAVRQNGPTSGSFMYKCADGYIAMNPVAGRNWHDLLLALEVDPADVPSTLQDDDRPPALVREFLESRLRPLPARQVFHALNELRIACGIAQGPLDLLSDPHLENRSFFKSSQHDRLGTIRVPGQPFHITAGESRVSDEGSKEFQDWSTLPGAGVFSTGPLCGLKIVDLTQAWLGPYASMLLADLGAVVVKIEAFTRPDSWRGAGTAQRPAVSGPSAAHWTTRPANPKAHPLNTSGSFNAVNRNKLSLNLDLTTDEGKAALLRLVAGADVLMENFTPRVMPNFGFDFETLSKARPGLVMTSFSGYGTSGPYRDFRANGATTDATCGWAFLTGYAGGPPTMMGIMEADPLCGLQMAASVLVGLEARDETGASQFVEGSMLEAGVFYIGEEILLASISQEQPARRGNRSRVMAPHGVFRCQGEDEWVAIAVRNDEELARLATIISVDARSLAAESLTSLKGHLDFQDEIESTLEDWTVFRSATEVARRLQASGIPAAPVQPFSKVLEDPHLTTRGWFIITGHPDMGAHRYNGYPWRFSRSECAVRLRAPLHGEHSIEVLSVLLGYSGPDIADLVRREVTGANLSAVQARSTPGGSSQR